MKYWLLFVQRIIAPVGLLGALSVWWISQSTLITAGLPVESGSIGFYAHHSGWSVYRRTRMSNLSDGSGWWTTRSMPDRERTTTAFEQIWSRGRRILPGLELHTFATGKAKPGRGHLVHISHWLVCVVFLTATLFSIWQWKTRSNADAGESQP